MGHGILERTGDLAVNRRRWGGHGILEMIDNQMLQSEFGPLRYCLVPSTTVAFGRVVKNSVQRLLAFSRYAP